MFNWEGSCLKRGKIFLLTFYNLHTVTPILKLEMIMCVIHHNCSMDLFDMARPHDMKRNFMESLGSGRLDGQMGGKK